MRLAAALAMILVLPGRSAVAQSDVEANGQIQFNFSNPGARSLALGGAFLALADDATAAFTNPAGLTILVKPEISAEGRLWDFKHSFTNAGRLAGARPSGLGIDTVSGLVDGTSTDHTLGPSFASFVYPKGRFVIAAYRAQAAKFEAHVQTQGAFLSNQPELRLLPTVSQMTLDIVDYGLSAAYRIADGVALGAGVAYYDFAIDSTTARYAFSSFTTGAAGNFYGLPNYAPGNSASRQTQTGSGRKFGYNFGLQIAQGHKLSLGAVYQHAPSFAFAAQNLFGPFPDPSFDGRVSVAKTATFDIPDILGVGVALRPTDAATLLADYRRVSYSDLVKNPVLIVPQTTAQPRDMRIGDADEFHFGLEYIFGRTKTPVAVRLGAWRDPDHRLYYAGAVSDADTTAKSANFRRGPDRWHGSGGLGVVFKSFQFDAGVDISSLAKTGSLALVLRF